MARSLVFNLDNNEYSAPIEKLDRKKLYGWVEKRYYDRDGDECYFGSLSSDGITIFGRESFESGYLNEAGDWCERAELTTVDNEGNPKTQVEASFKQTISLEKKVSIDEYLQHVAKSVYQLDSPTLLECVKKHPGEIFTFPFNYTASYQPDDAFLIENEDALFMVIGQATQFEFIEAHQIEQALLSEDEEDDDDEDIDFSMF